MKKKAVCLLAAGILLLSGCGNSGSGSTAAAAEQKGVNAEELHLQYESDEDPDSVFTPGQAVWAAFHAEHAEGEDGVLVDTAHLSEGYIAFSAQADHQLKVMVLKDDAQYVYDLDNQGTPSVFPLQCGDGTYTFRVMENVSGSKYGQIYSLEEEVSMPDPVSAFLIPHVYVNFDESSLCVEEAAEIAGESHSELDFVLRVYDYICENYEYDTEKANSHIESPYIPDLDEVYNTRMGICVDFAATVAAMLRSQGVPCKIIYGYVGDIYHAWNMFYSDETGWVTVEYSVKGTDWNRIDATFKSTGADDSFVLDDENYVEVYIY